MSIGKALLQPGKFRPIIGQQRMLEVEWVIELLTRLGVHWAEGGHFRAALEEEGAEVFVEFLGLHQKDIERSVGRLEKWLGPVKTGFETFAQTLIQKEGIAEIEYVLDTFDKLLDKLTRSGIEKAVNDLFDILEQELDTMVLSLKVQLVLPILDRVITRLAEAYRAGDMGKEAFNDFMIANRLRQLRDLVLQIDIDVPDFEANMLLKPLLKKMDSIGYEEKRLKAKEYLGVAKSMSGKIHGLLQLNFNTELSANVSRSRDAAPQPPEKILWYASWLTGKDFKKRGGMVYENKMEQLFVSNSDFVQALNSGTVPEALRARFGTAGAALSNDLFLRTQTDNFEWHIEDNGNKKKYSLLWNGTDLEVYKGEVYKTEEWHRIYPMQPYKFGIIGPDACDKIVFHVSWSFHLLEALVHFISMEPTSKTGPRSDMFSNLANALIQLTFTGIKVSGTSAFGWRKEDFEPSEHWRWTFPLGVTLPTTLESMHVKSDGCASFIYWLTLLGADYSEIILYRHWGYSIKELTFSTITLLNHEKTQIWPELPLSEVENTPHNQRELTGVAMAFVDLSVWINVWIYPRWLYGIPNGDNGKLWGEQIGRWLGLGTLFGWAGASVGVFTSYALSRSFYWAGWWKTVLYYAWWAPWLKFQHYLYLTTDGDTAGGTYLTTGDINNGYGDSFPFAGYPPKDSSPYRLPYPKGEVWQCAQGNMGLWSHTPHSFSFQIYSFDFTHELNDPVAAIRSGVVWSYIDDEADSGDDQNHILILHDLAVSGSEGHDMDNAGNINVRTIGMYVHGAKDSIKPAFAARGITIDKRSATDASMRTPAVLAAFNAVGINILSIVSNANNRFSDEIAVVLDSSGVPIGPVVVNRGDIIMGAGDTGRSAYNHLHINVFPVNLDAMGNINGWELYTIPFVFGDVGGDGVPKALKYYESDNDQ